MYLFVVITKYLVFIVLKPSIERYASFCFYQLLIGHSPVFSQPQIYFKYLILPFAWPQIEISLKYLIRDRQVNSISEVDF